MERFPRIRAARPEDGGGIARVHVESWRTTYQGLVPEEYLAGLSIEQRREAWRRRLEVVDGPGFAVVAEEEDGEIVGFAAGGPERDGTHGFAGELYAIYLLQGRQGRGIGQMLFDAVVAGLMARGTRDMMLWVVEENPSRGFYDRMGGQVFARKLDTIGGAALFEVAYGWSDLSALSGRPVETPESYLWRSEFFSGHEHCRLECWAERMRLTGSAIFLHQGLRARLDYTVECNPAWETRSATVSGWIEDRAVQIEIAVADGRWLLNGEHCPAVDGCIDLDLNFSPSTNLLPVRRLSLPVGGCAEVTAAWLRFPSLELERLEQGYERLSETVYRYRSSGGSFVADLELFPSGMVRRYPGVWTAIQG